MNRFIFLISFLFFGFSANAQWFPFPLAQKSFYQYNNILYGPSDTTINIYYVDSIVDFGTHQIYHFDYSTPDYNGCYETVNHDPNIYPGSNIDRVRPDSIIQQNDSLLLAFSDGYFYSSSFSDSILFLPTIKKDSSWFSPIKGSTSYNFLKFTCDNIFLDTIIGNVVDSVKLISIQAFDNATPVASDFDTLSLLLSKNYGFKQFVSFFTNVKETTLVGLDTGITQEGFILPQFSDYFHLSVGDIIIWEKLEDSFPFSTITYYKDSIINVISTPDSVKYDLVINSSTGMQSTGVQKYYKNKLKALWFSTSIFCPGTTTNSWNWGASDDDLLESSGIYYTNDSVVNRIFNYYGFQIDTTNCDITEMIDLYGDVHYNTYYGLTSFLSGAGGGYIEWAIVGSIINGVQIGNVWNVGLNELVKEQTFEIYPNPNNGVELSIAGENLKAIEILNLQGQLVLHSNIYDKITPLPINSLAKGIYFVKAFFTTNEVVVKKLVIN